MKYRYIWLVCLVALLCVPAVVSAEGFLPGMTSLGEWSCAPGHKPNCSVAGSLGYLGNNRGLSFDMAAVATNLRNISKISLQYPVEGAWVGASATGTGPERGFSACDPGDGLCLSLGASWLFPNNKEESETYHTTVDARRTWRPITQWYTLEASAARCGWSNFSLIGGFRYDSFSTKFTDSVEDPPGFGGNVRQDEAELILTSYIPYVGAETTWGAVKVGVIGFPWVPGNIQYRETLAAELRHEAEGNYRNGYFLETFLQLGRRMGAVDLSAFATYTSLHATGEFDLSVSEVGAPVGLTQPFNFGIDRQNWIVGGKAVIGFASPL